MMKSLILALLFLLPLLLVLLFSSCYTLQEGGSYLGLLLRAKPISWLRQQPDTSAETLAFFDRVERIKAFSINVMGLNSSKNYNHYIMMERDYLNQVLSASPDLELRDYLWDYPLVGKLPYRGYFNQDRLELEQQRLVKLGHDTLVRKVDAFSTLGYLSDPLFSYMRHYDEHRLADLIIHESVHASIFLAQESAFNESLATFIGQQGSLLYLKQLYGTDSVQIQLVEDRRHDAQTLQNLLAGLRKQLQQIYQDSSLSPDFKREQKAQLIASFQQNLTSQSQQLFRSEGYRKLGQLSINNAYLNLYALYFQDSYQPIWQELLQQAHQSLPQMVANLVKLKKIHGAKLAQYLRAQHTPTPP